MTTIKCAIDEGRIARLRPQAGKWFRSLRQSAQVTVIELAEQVGVDTDEVGAYEHGVEAVPAALYPDFAAVFGVSVQDFAKSCLMFGNPSAYEALFGSLPEVLRAAA
jgi:transcriptional regulator with XRE-family HTH domain